MFAGKIDVWFTGEERRPVTPLGFSFPSPSVLGRPPWGSSNWLSLLAEIDRAIQMVAV